LKRLDLSNNGLKKFPAKLCDLDLSILNLTNNELDENDFPLEAEKYQNMIELVLDKNSFKHLPKVIGKLKNLERLSLQHNSLVDLKYVHQLKKLKFLILDSNNLTQLEEKMSRLQNLEILHLRHNFIVDLDVNIMKSNMNMLKQLDLSFNKLTTVAIEIFMLPHLEMLNLSNNKINLLPIIPTSYFRTIPIWLCDLSSNNLIRFYEFLLTICDNIDLSSNKIRTIPMKAFDKLTTAQLEKKVLKIEHNPLNDPPIEFCRYGLKVLKSYFEEEIKNVQLNKGYKLIFLGDNNSGKTMLAHALEDHYSSTNFTDQFTIQGNIEKESKLVEIHEFFIKNSQSLTVQETNIKRNTFTVNTKLVESNSLSAVKTLKTTAAFGSSFSNSLSMEEPKLELLTSVNELNAFSNKLLQMDQAVKTSSRMQVSIYDFNGSLNQFQHLTEMFLDKCALIVLAIDAPSVQADELNSNGEIKWSSYLKRLLDMISLKTTKNNTYFLLPVLTKWDRVVNPRNDPEVDNSVVAKVERFFHAHLKSRLDDIREELRLIELLPNISASQSDRLKHLVNTQNNLTPTIYSQFQRVSSTRSKNIDKLAQTIQDIVLGDQKRFPSINTKVPTFWTEVERFCTTVLSALPKTKFVNNNLHISPSSIETQMSILLVEYDFYKKTIVEKYGMSHLVESITKYLSSCGKIIWFQDNAKKREKVFLRPNILFDLLYVLFRTNFKDNFLDDHVETLRSKLIQEPVKGLDALISDLLTKGIMSMELLKLIWCPILITNSSELIREVLLMFANYFNVCYPELSKDKMRLLFNAKEVRKENMESIRTFESPSVYEISQLSFTSTKFTQVVVPFYLPCMTDIYELNKVRDGMALESRLSVDFALRKQIKKEKPLFLARLAHKYVFPWGLMPGVFEKFSCDCIINSELYYKYHFKNFIQAYNEHNTIG
jgi:Leucine-rich repeat (LRR) protein